ncbi:hypothetical protein HPB48_020500 [Haemaphysalis longicornis]|uniref:Uncharacterized protein n=1 Tax=Haemaphysalis longicornis TaxID=44386 RepID=A0A9J6GA49_HAELO|nr:hypothetical protein HPB48_020500 [Haemaphysalis longicornis]
MQVALKYCQGSFVPCIHTRGVARENLVQREEQRSGDAPKKAFWSQCGPENVAVSDDLEKVSEPDVDSSDEEPVQTVPAAPKRAALWNATDREPVTVLAKLFHGKAATSVSRFVATLQAMLYNVGYNEWLHAILLQLVPEADANQAEYEHVERKVRKVPHLRDHSPDYFPSFNVCAANASMF